MILSTLSFLVVFTIVVLVHESGHYLAARRAGVSVYEFSLGFPFSPRIATLFRYRETEFTLRLLPLGGFVSFSPDGNEADDGLFNASVMNRALILSAGSIFNIAFAFIVLTVVYTTGKHLPVIDAVIASAATLWSAIAGTADLLARAFTGSGSWEGIAGPVGIAVLAGKAAAHGALPLIYFTAMLSLSLGIMNLIPFPALDGGQLFMLMIEALTRKPISMRTYQVMNLIGFSAFILLSVLVTYKDIARLLV